MNINTDFLFRFRDGDTKLKFRVAAAKQNKSINTLLNEVVAQYLKTVKEVA